MARSGRVLIVVQSTPALPPSSDPTDTGKISRLTCDLGIKLWRDPNKGRRKYSDQCDGIGVSLYRSDQVVRFFQGMKNQCQTAELVECFARNPRSNPVKRQQRIDSPRASLERLKRASSDKRAFRIPCCLPFSYEDDETPSWHPMGPFLMMLSFHLQAARPA